MMKRNHTAIYFRFKYFKLTLMALNFLPGILIHGPSGCGKTSLARWLAQEGKGHFKFLSVACADLVHKVCQMSFVGYKCDLL